MPHPAFPMEMTEPEVESAVREVTDAEVAHLHEHGWVMLRSLVDTACVGLGRIVALC
jgi:hypothetical protein